MMQFSATHFDEICAAEGVRDRIGAIEAERKVAVRKFWIRGLIGLALSVAALVTLLNSGWEVVAFLAFAAGLVVTLIAAMKPLGAAKEGLKLPVLDEIARKAGMEYLPGDFTPPVYGSAARLLFGRVTGETFSDLFHGADEAGLGYAVYEGNLQRRSGKHTVTIFSGQIYALHRAQAGGGYTAIVPDRKIFNFFKPASDMERVKFEEDDAFERRFEVYSTAPAEARQLVGPELRRQLLELREKNGRVLAFVGPGEALVAVSGKDRFEPGSMFRSRAGQERVKLMFDDVCASFGLLKDLRAKLG
jgi:hypothetical protein